ncbi:MAG TPA: hypothetical protein VFF73_22740, partial [Planctomycetota bacterium]|nr:hypothetical protein [Planctomycetota bacterium]
GRRNALRITIGENGHLGISSDHERPGDTAFVDSGVPILVPSAVADAFSGIVIDWASDAKGRVGFCFEGTARALDHSLARELRARLEASSKSRVDAPRPGLGPGEDPGGAR